jgi:hypothetical protein
MAVEWSCLNRGYGYWFVGASTDVRRGESVVVVDIGLLTGCWFFVWGVLSDESMWWKGGYS